MAGKTAWLEGNPGTKKPWLGPSLANSSALPQANLQGFSSARAMQPSILLGRESVLPTGSGEQTYIDRSPYPWFLIGLSSCK